MKKGLLRKVAVGYERFFPTPWRRVKSEFMRRAGRWVQIISFHPLSGSDDYNPVCCFEFLPKPGPATGGMLPQPLRTKKGVGDYIWAGAKEDKSPSVFQRMAEQFRPSLQQPLKVEDIKALLADRSDDWAHVYALCVMAAEEGYRAEAERWLILFKKMNEGIPYPQVTERINVLENYLKLMDAPDELKRQLDALQTQKLKALGLEN